MIIFSVRKDYVLVTREFSGTAFNIDEKLLALRRRSLIVLSSPRWIFILKYAGSSRIPRRIFPGDLSDFPGR